MYISSWNDVSNKFCLYMEAERRSLTSEFNFVGLHIMWICWWHIMPHLVWCHSLLIYMPMPFSWCQLKTWNTNMPDVGRIMHSILMLRISPFYTKSEFPFWVTGKVVPRLSRRRKPVDNSVLKVDRAWVGFLLGMHRIDCSADDTQLKGRMFQSDFRGS